MLTHGYAQPACMDGAVQHYILEQVQLICIVTEALQAAAAIRIKHQTN